MPSPVGMNASNTGATSPVCSIQSNSLLTTSENDASEPDSSRPITCRRGAGGGTKSEALGKRKRSNIEVVVPKLVYPSSIYKLPDPPKSAWYSETEVLDRLYLQTYDNFLGEHTTFMLEDFTVYTPQQFDNGKFCKTPLEMVKLSALNVAISMDTPFLVDGSIGYKRCDQRYVKKIKIKSVSVDYSEVFVRPKIWLQSCSVTRDNDPVWYELGTPSGNYQRYYEPFLWLATLGVHFFAYINHPSGPGGECCLENFRRDFRTWLNDQFKNRKHRNGGEQYHKAWLEQIGNAEDFRQYVSAHCGWLWHELNHIRDLGLHSYEIPLWGEVCTMTAIPRAHQGKGEENVVTTPYIYSIFEKMYGPYLKKVMVPQRMNLVEIPVRRRKSSLRPEDYVPNLGDVVAIGMDEEGYWSRQKRPHGVPGISEWSHGYWFGWVKKICREQVNIIWLYGPEDTIVDPETYPWPNELFFSDHCNCSDNSECLSLAEIAGKVDVVFWPNDQRLPKHQYFVRQKYRTKNPAFLSLKRSDLAKLIQAPQQTCLEKQGSLSLYERIKHSHTPGDTILYAPSEGTLLEPAVVVSYNDDNLSIKIRRLLRQSTMNPDAKPNEVTFSEAFEDIPSSAVARKCYVQVFSTESPVEVPYNRNGTGDCFFIRSDQPPSEEFLRLGYTSSAPISKPLLSGLDLFCGGGNFGRGLEEGGVVKMMWAVDFDSGPLHTYRANMDNVDDTRLYLGSVNNYLESAILGEYSEEKGIPRPGEVDVISAGSPCQGFSVSNSRRHEEKGLRKSALVCSLATAVDFYRPKYVLLENVPPIASDRMRSDGTIENTYATLLSAMIGMGYQCESFICDAWSHGNAQYRSRVILAMTKRDCNPIARPTRSHYHPVECRRTRCIGRSAYRFNGRELDGMCPFPSMTMWDAYKHLPDIGDGHVMLPILYPDHLSATRYNARIRLLMTQIPRHQADGLNSWRGGVLAGYVFKGLWGKLNGEGETDGEEISSKSELVLQNKSCRSWTRTKFNGLCPTVQTKQSPQCARLGATLHPEEHRVLSLQELKIAQGFPDEELLVGAPSLRLHVIGNSVARGVALSLGIALREAYLAEED